MNKTMKALCLTLYIFCLLPFFAFKNACVKYPYEYYGSKWVSDDGIIKIEMFIAEQRETTCNYSLITYKYRTKMYYNTFPVSSISFYRAIDDADFGYFDTDDITNEVRYDAYFSAQFTELLNNEKKFTLSVNFHEFLLAFTGSANNIPENLEYTFTLTLVE